MRRTRPASMSPARPVRPVPALFETMTRSRAPCSSSAAKRSSGAPAPPKPPHSTVAPSRMPATASASDFTRLSIIAAPLGSERHRVAALQGEQLARLLRRGDVERQVLEDGADAGDLLGVALRELALAEIEAVLEADTDVAAHDRRGGDEGELMPAGRQHR